MHDCQVVDNVECFLGLLTPYQFINLHSHVLESARVCLFVFQSHSDFDRRFLLLHKLVVYLKELLQVVEKYWIQGIITMIVGQVSINCYYMFGLWRLFRNV